MAQKKAKSNEEKTERVYTITLRKKSRKVPGYKRAPKAVKAVKEFLARHMKIYDRDLNKIKIDSYLNEFMWFRGIKKPPYKIKVKAIKESGKDEVRVELAEIPDKLRFKKAREEKREKEASESKKKRIFDKGQEEIKEEKTEEQKKEESEKVKAGEEVMKKMEKSQAKQMKHQADARSKQPKRQQRKALKK